MSLASRAGDLYYTFRFIKMLTTPWEDTDAFKLGLIDNNGKRDKSKKISTAEEKDAYSTFMRLVFNVKRLLNKVPGGSSKLASYAAALFLIKEKYEMSDKSIDKIVANSDLDFELLEGDSSWYTSDAGQLGQGVYRLNENKLDITHYSEIANKNDTVRVKDGCFPVGNVLGHKVYCVEHINTGHSLYITLGEITR